MLRNLMIATLLASFCPAHAKSPTAMTFHSVSVSLPVGDQMFPGGDKATAINGNCLACHSASMVLYQPPMTKVAWSTEVHKMINTYKAPVSPQDAEAVIAYLVETKGK
jgi:hypothetical protein